MRIVAADILEYVRPLDGRSWNPVSRWTERRAPVLLLHGETGVIGIGEAWCSHDEIGRVLGRLTERLAGVVGSVIDDAVLGSFGDTRHHATPRDRADAATESALDLALWDLCAKTRGEPLWRTLAHARERNLRDPAQFGADPDCPGRVSKAPAAQVRVYASGGLYRDGAGIDELIADVERWRREGFRDVKIKVGGRPLEVDLARIRAVRDALGVDAELWVDAVNQLHPADAVGIAQRYRDAGATAIQAPVAFDDVTTMAAIRTRALPVVAGETEYDAGRFARMLDAGAVAMVQANLSVCGGFGGLARLVRAAQQSGVGVTLQAHGTAILLAASLHAGAGMRGIVNVEYHRFHDHLGHLVPAPMRCPTDGRVMLDAERPGIGIDTVAVGTHADGGEIRLRATLR